MARAPFEWASPHERAESALRESESKFRQIFNSTNDSMFVTDLLGRFLEVNDSACQQLGYTREELLALRRGRKIDAAPVATPPASRLTRVGLTLGRAD